MMKLSLFPTRIPVILSFFLAIIVGLVPEITHPKSALSAEKVRLVYGMFNCSLSVETLETYAKTGEITNEFKFYAKFLDDDTLIQLRHWLQKKFYRDRVSIYRYTKSTEGEEVLQEIGTVVSTHSKRNGFYAIRAAVIQAAGEGESWTILDVIDEFPTENLQINTKELFKLQKFWKESKNASLEES